MINIVDKNKCCGCEACVQCCPNKCISMYEDKEGFLYPKVDIENCIDCGLCEKVCPEINLLSEKQPIKVLGAKLKDKDIILKSSSGGIFSYIANKVLDEGGVVFGARFDDEWNVIHDYTETKEGLIPFRKSKYVQSRIGDTFKKAKAFLKQGRKVLFTGTPCQIKSLKLFLKKDYENLLTIDIVCHGVPSPKIWKIYLNSFLTEKNIVRSDILDIDFRDKQNGWINFSFSIKYNNNNSISNYTQLFYDNIYMQAFLSNLILRPSCENCTAKCGQSNSDLTIADFWGINIINPSFYEKNGVSLVLVNSTKGIELMQSKELDIVKTSIEKVIEFNAGLNSSLYVHQKRDIYLNKLDETTDFISYTKKILRVPLHIKVKRIIRKIYNHIVR